MSASGSPFVFESHPINKTSLTLGSHTSYLLNSNRGQITIGDHCSVICENNVGQINMGKHCTITSCKNNCGTIIIGPGCKLEIAKYNAGHIKVGAGALVGNIDGNSGSFGIGADAEASEEVKNNTGQILVDGRILKGQVSVQEPKPMRKPTPPKPMPPKRRTASETAAALETLDELAEDEDAATGMEFFMGKIRQLQVQPKKPEPEENWEWELRTNPTPFYDAQYVMARRHQLYVAPPTGLTKSQRKAFNREKHNFY